MDRHRQLGTEDTETKVVYSIYVEEMSLTLRELMVGVWGEGARGGRHFNKYKKGLEKRHMTKHWLDCHRGKEKAKFEVMINRSITPCLVKQLSEAIKIRRRL